METALYLLARLVIGVVRRLPLRGAAWLGRCGGTLAYWLDHRHRRVALDNLALAFGREYPPRERRAIARENFRRIGENFACAARTAFMDERQIAAILDLERVAIPAPEGADAARCRVIAIGHFGNFELYARAGRCFPGYQYATTYRALRQPALNRLLQQTRERSGCLYFERRRDFQALREAMLRQRLIIGFLADQHAGDRGLRVPFFGHDASTSAAPAVFALRYECPLQVAVCYRVALARWRIEVSDPIPTHDRGQPRTVEAITGDINRAFEAAVRRDPANWFWVHKRWKPGKYRSVKSEGRKPKTEGKAEG